MTDKELIQKAQQGDRRSFDTLINLYYERLHNGAMKVVRDKDVAQDILQDSMIKAFKALPPFKGDSMFYTWMYRIVQNTSYDYLSKEKRKSSVITDTYEEDLNSGEDYSPEDYIEAEQALEKLNQLIEDMPVKLASVFHLSNKGMSYEGISKEIGCPIGTVRSRLSRAKEYVRKGLECN